MVSVNMHLDKVSLITTIEDPIQFSAMLSHVYSLKQEVINLPQFFWKEEYRTHVRIPIQEHERLHIVAGTTNHSLYFKFDFNAGNLHQTGWNSVSDVIGGMFNDASSIHDGYEAAYALLRVNRIELAADISGVEYKDIHAVDYKVRSFNDHYFEAGGLYLGSRGSKREFHIYDKSNQLQNVKGKSLGYPLSRIECRLRQPKLSIADISKLPNPFLSLVVFNPEANPVTSNPTIWNEYRTRLDSSHKTAQGAYFSFKNSNYRKLLDWEMYKRRLPWWQPNDFWQQAKGAILKLHPNKINDPDLQSIAKFQT